MEAVNYQRLVLTPAQFKSVLPTLTSWRTVYPVIKDLPDSDASLKKLAHMLAVEMQNKNGPRSQILTRLHMRINAMRQRIEVAQITKAAKR